MFIIMCHVHVRFLLHFLAPCIADQLIRIQHCARAAILIDRIQFAVHFNMFAMQCIAEVHLLFVCVHGFIACIPVVSPVFCVYVVPVYRQIIQKKRLNNENECASDASANAAATESIHPSSNNYRSLLNHSLLYCRNRSNLFRESSPGF